MATPRLPFLWPMLWKPQVAPHIRSRARAQRPKRSVSTTSYRGVEAPIQRYGKAHEPAPHLREQLQNQADPTPPKVPHDPAKDIEEEEEELDSPVVSTTPPSTPAQPSTTSDTPPAPPPPPPPAQQKPDEPPLDSVLHMPGPSDEAHKHPHLKTPPYVHHFDTYTLVRQLVMSNYSEAQSITLMKAVRGILINNIILARAGLVSKSNVENETYLFRAACAELKTEIGNSRRGEVERMRTERNQLQHEVDILGQKLGQETGTVKDDLKGLFDDRKMAVRQEQRSMETKIQELNYQITIKLNSDARSEVEGLRWVLTRRIAMGIATMATMVILLLQVNSSRKHELKEEQRKKDEAKQHPPPVDDGRGGNGGSGGGGSGGGGGGGMGMGNGGGMAMGMSGGNEEALGGELLATEGVSLG